MITLARACALLSLTVAVLHGQVPQIINYQGRVAVGTMNFDGTGGFKFALVNAAGDTSYWSNDGTSTTGNEPAAAVPLTVTKGLYSVLLGDNMTAIPASVFANGDVYLRVWFDDGTANGSQLLTPDQRIAAVGYAMVAANVQPGADIVAGTVTGTAFVGDGSGLTNIPASAVNSAVTPVADMVWIQAGEFLIGSPSGEVGRGDDEDDTTGAGGAQVRTLITQGFWIGKYEVTQQEYQTLLGINPSEFTGNLNRPVERVSWNDAVVYCAKLTIQERAAGRLPVGYEYRLATEAEWEYACRAGTTTSFSYGDDAPASLTNYAWYDSNSESTTHPVGEKSPNAWGLYDMHGNVREWCQDRYEPSYPSGALIDPQGPASGTSHVDRGGSWNRIADFTRCADRNDNGPANALNGIGFRAVLAPGQP